MAKAPKPRSRMTAQSKVNIEAATSATLIPSSSGGYNVELQGKHGTCFVSNAEGPISYSSMAIAKDAVKKHNSNLNPSLAPTI